MIRSTIPFMAGKTLRIAIKGIRAIDTIATELIFTILSGKPVVTFPVVARGCVVPSRAYSPNSYRPDPETA